MKISRAPGLGAPLGLPEQEEQGDGAFHQPTLLCGSELLLHAGISTFWGSISISWGALFTFWGDIPIFWGVLSISWGDISIFFGDISTFSQQGEAARHGPHLPCPDVTPTRCWLSKLPISYLTGLCWLSPR